MGYWKSKVLPKINKVFGKNGKKSAAAEACKGFEESKEGINKEFEEKKAELQPKVIEIYEASSAEVKTVVKERKESGLKKNSAGVQSFLEELAKIDFPGSKTVSESCSQYGPTLVPGPVFFVFEKVSTFIVTEEKDTATTTEETAREIDAAAATEETSKEKDAASTTEEAGEEKGVVAEEKKEEGTEKEEVKEEEEVMAEKSEPVPSEPAKAVEEEAPKA